MVSASPHIVKLADLYFNWPKAKQPVLDIKELSIGSGEQIFIIGPSGSGKSTLLSILGGILKPQHGMVSVLGHEISTLTSSERDQFRADHIGFIFQMFNLIPYLSIVENVTLPCQFSRIRKQRVLNKAISIQEEALRLLRKLNLSDEHLLSKPVIELSVGQQQRVAAARALIGSPEIIIADEPTSSLDSDHRQAFINLLFEECAQTNTTLIFVSHDTSLAELFHRTVKLHQLNNVVTFQQELGGIS